MSNINYTKPDKLEDFSVWCSKKYPLWCKSNFPFIEDTFEALDTYGLICKIVQYLNETKQNLNTTEDNVQNIYNFVTNYFDNLDVQNEINNKLDSMVSSGELQKLLTEQYNSLKNEVNSKINLQDSKIQNIESKVNSATSGSPAGVYDTLEDLMQENPSHDKIYVVKEDGEWYYWDSSIEQWNNGGVYQSTVLETDKTLTIEGMAADSQITGNVTKNINNISRKIFNNIIPCMNYCDNLNIQNGTYYGGSTGKIATKNANGYAIIPAFPVIAGVKYYSNKFLVSNIFSFITDKKGNIINDFSNLIDSTNYGKFTPNVDGFAYITLYGITENNQKNLLEEMIMIDSNRSASFIEYNKPYDFLILNDSYKANVLNKHTKIYVGTDKEFQTIKSAIASIKDSSSSKIYDVIIDDGTYQESNITLPNYINLIGASGNREKCIIKGYNNPNVEDSAISGTSTINMNYNNELHNLTITAQNMRYPIHSESGGNFKDWIQKVFNCHIEHLGNQEVIDYRLENNLETSGIWTSCHAWGEGASSGANLLIENTTIKSIKNAFYCHAAANIEKPYFHKLKNCELITLDINSIFVDDTTSPINNNTLIVEDCFINGRVGIVGTNKYNMIISGSGLKPIYQKPERVLDEKDFPIFTDYLQEYVANEDLSKGNFVYTTDGKTIQKANSTTPHKLIVGYVVGNHSAGDLVKIMKGYMQPLTQTWPETEIISGLYYGIGNNSNLVQVENIENAIAISNKFAYKLFI